MTKQVEQHKKLKREISAGIIVFRRTREGPKFLLLYHGGSYWNFPKGKIESEERSLAAALRETKEETGLSSNSLNIIRNFKAHERFYFKRGNQPTFKIVIIFLAVTESVNVRVSREHQGYGWFLFKDANRILGRYKDSQKVLKEAYDFLRKRGSTRT